MRGIVRFLIPALLLAAIILGFITVMTATHWGTLKFSDEGCDPDQQGRHPYGPPREGILGFAWMTENTLVVEAYIKTHVEGARIGGDYRLEGNHLRLLYQDKAAGPATIMTCPHRVVYQISNLRQDDYLISIQPMDGHSTSLEFSSERCAADIDPYGPPYEGNMSTMYSARPGSTLKYVAVSRHMNPHR